MRKSPNKMMLEPINKENRVPPRFVMSEATQVSTSVYSGNKTKKSKLNGSFNSSTKQLDDTNRKATPRRTTDGAVEPGRFSRGSRTSEFDDNGTKLEFIECKDEPMMMPQSIGAVPHAINSGNKFMVFRPLTLGALKTNEICIENQKDNELKRGSNAALLTLENEIAKPIDKGYYYKIVSAIDLKLLRLTLQDNGMCTVPQKVKQMSTTFQLAHGH